MIRYFATTDWSTIGRVAHHYLSSLLRIGPVRLISGGELVGPWSYFQPLLITPITKSFINVVCTEPSRWAWTHRVSMPVNGDPSRLEWAAEKMTLYTPGHRNVLLAGWGTRDKDQLSAAFRFEKLIVPSEAARDLWTASGAWPILIQVPVTEHEAFRDAVRGSRPTQGELR